MKKNSIILVDQAATLRGEAALDTPLAMAMLTPALPAAPAIGGADGEARVAA